MSPCDPSMIGTRRSARAPGGGGGRPWDRGSGSGGASRVDQRGCHTGSGAHRVRRNSPHLHDGDVRPGTPTRRVRARLRRRMRSRKPVRVPVGSVAVRRGRGDLVPRCPPPLSAASRKETLSAGCLRPQARVTAVPVAHRAAERLTAPHRTGISGYVSRRSPGRKPRRQAGHTALYRRAGTPAGTPRLAQRWISAPHRPRVRRAREGHATGAVPGRASIPGEGDFGGRVAAGSPIPTGGTTP